MGTMPKEAAASWGVALWSPDWSKRAACPKKYSRPYTDSPVCQMPSTCLPMTAMDIAFAMPRDMS